MDEERQQLREIIYILLEEFKIWLAVPRRCFHCEIMGFCRGDSKNGYRCSSKGCLLLWHAEHEAHTHIDNPSPQKSIERKNILSFQKAKEISLEEVRQLSERKHEHPNG